MSVFGRLIGPGLIACGLLATVQTVEGAPSTAPAPAVSLSVGDAAAGKETFAQECSICHGVSGKGFIGPYIAGVNWTAPGLIAIVRGGVGGYGSMPAFNAAVVTDANITNVAAYLASLAPAPPSKSSPAQQANAPAPASSSKAVSTVAVNPSAQAAAPSSSAAQSATSGAGDAVHGHQVYAANCAACHGANGQGGVGPVLNGEKTRKDTAAAIAWIKNPKLPMPKLYPSVLSEKDVQDVAAYVESL